MSLSDVRTAKFRKNQLLETLLHELNDDLCRAEEQLMSHHRQMDFPVVLVMGPLRSGTTLFTQWLANTGLVAYPTNLLSRFYRAPIIGAKIQLLLTDPRYNFRDELGEFAQKSEYKSENGKTTGVLAPNEFWYFWRRFLADPGRDVWTDDELEETMDTGAMIAELAGIMDVFQKPFAAKGMLFNYNIPFLDSIFEKALFVQIKRNPVTNVASVLEARRRQLGDEGAWYSFKIPEYEKLKGMDPVTQAAGQVHYIDDAVSRAIAGLPESRRMVVEYESFCRTPELTFNELTKKINMPGVGYVGPLEFKQTREILANSNEIVSALRGVGCDFPRITPSL